MDRRSFIKRSAIAAPAAAATLAAPAYAQGKRTLTMVTTWGRGLAGVDDAADFIVNRVGAMSDGTLEIEKKSAGELVGALEVFDAVTAGQADLYHSADYFFTGQHPALAYFTGVPFGLTAQEMMVWYYHDGGKELHHEIGEILGLKTFLAGNTGAQAGGWFAKEINAPEDFAGLRFRMPGLGGKALGKLGASVQTIPGSEVYAALASGAIDGTEWIGPWADERSGFQEITKYYYTSGFHEPGVALSLASNLDVFNELSPAHQQIIETVAAETHQWNLALFLKNNGPALLRLRDQGVQILEFPDAVWDAFGQASKETLDEFMDDEIFARVRNSAESSMRNTSAWVARSEGVFTRQRDRVIG